MSITYNDLITISPVNAYSKANDLTTDLPRLVARAHEKVVQKLDHDLFETNLGSIPLPTTGIGDFSGLGAGVEARILEFRSVTVDDGSGDSWALLPRDRGVLRALYPDNPQGAPKYYETPAIGLRVWPRPDAAMTATVWANVEPLTPTSGNQSNVILTKHPNVMEWAVAREVALFLLDEAMSARFEAEMNEALLEANRQIGRRRRDESAQRPTEARNVVGS
jgi:hypothetical protein